MSQFAIETIKSFFKGETASVVDPGDKWAKSKRQSSHGLVAFSGT